jgi:hypothetical protein
MTNKSVLLVAPPHHGTQRRVYEIGERLEVAVCSWLGAAGSAQYDESKKTGKYKQRYT